MPEGPAVAAWRVLQGLAHHVDGADLLLALHAAIGAHGGAPATLLVEDLRARLQQTCFHHRAEGHAWLALAALHRGERAFVQRQFLFDPRTGNLAIVRLALASDPLTAQPLGHRARGAGAEEGVEHHVPLLRRRQQHAVQQRLWLLRGMGLVPVLILQPLSARTDRKGPVAAHLDLVVQRLHRGVVELVLRLFALAGPQQGFVRIGEPGAAKVGHRVGLAPHDVVQDPEAQVLQHRAHAIDVVIAANHPQRAIGLQHAAAFGQPAPGEGVVGAEAVEPVPIVGHRIHVAAVGPIEIAAKLQVVGGIGEDQVHAVIGQFAHRCHAVAIQDLPQWQVRLVDHCSFRLAHTRSGANFRHFAHEKHFPHLSTGV